ncbi:MAG: hypothetical protein E7316_03395 [Clostridiales bacterium]|nr:hypothetical protein [Clostridiales bacterium]
MTLSLNEQKAIQMDRMRYTKNTFSSRMVYLAILFDVLYFVNIYESDVGNWYYTWLIGISIVYNLVFMLISFLASEGVKNYKLGYGIALLVLGAGQIVRIFILPLMAHSAMTKRVIEKQAVEVPVMEAGQFILVIVYLCLSAACSIVAGIVAVQRSHKLAAYNASLIGKA